MGSKYRAKPTTIDGIRFASQREAARYGDLKLLARSGIINNLSLQVEFPVTIGGIKVFSYFSDFSYIEDDKLIIEDSKGFRTPVYRLKKKIVEAVYGIKIRET